MNFGRVRAAFRLPPALWASYGITFLLVGTLMNRVGTELQIARFEHGWQVFTVYVLYMVPIAALLRRLPWWQQYLYGLFPMSLLEFGGYALETSHAYPHNVLDRIFGERNFALAMALCFAAAFPLLNALVSRFHAVLVASRPRAGPYCARHDHDIYAPGVAPDSIRILRRGTCRGCAWNRTLRESKPRTLLQWPAPERGIERNAQRQPMITKYIEHALKRARYEQLEDKSFAATVNGLRGVIAMGRTLEDCRRELAEVVEEWILVRVAHDLPIPKLGNVTIRVKRAG